MGIVERVSKLERRVDDLEDSSGVSGSVKSFVATLFLAALAFAVCDILDDDE